MNIQWNVRSVSGLLLAVFAFVSLLIDVAGIVQVWVLREPVTRRTAVAMAVAFAGVGLMLGAPGAGNATGDLLALLMALAFALALVITRHRRDVSMAPATCLAQLMLLAAFLPLSDPGDVGGDDLAALAALGVGQMALGLALLTIGARLISAAQVALISLLEVVLGPLWVWLATGEEPGTATLLGGAIVIVAILIQTERGAARAAQRAGPPPLP